MITLRHGPRLEDRFTMISNDVFQRADLSFRAKAIYGYLMSCRSGWQLTRDRIAEALEVSAGTIRRALEELEDAGYLVRSQSKGPDGRFNAVEYTIFSEPVPGSRVPRKAGKPADTVCTNLSNGDEQQEGTVSAGQTECANLTPLIRTIKTKKIPRNPLRVFLPPRGATSRLGS